MSFSMNESWINEVQQIEKKYLSESSIDLVDCFYRLKGAIEGRKLLLKEHTLLNLDRKMIQEEIDAEEQSLPRLLKKLSVTTHSQIEPAIQSKKKYIQDLKNFLDNTLEVIPFKKTFYSITVMYIQTLAAIFHSATGRKPECLRFGYYDDDGYYYGDFYNFLTDSKKLLIELGIKLPKDSTLGQRACELAKWDRLNGIQIYMYGSAFEYLEISNPIY